MRLQRARAWRPRQGPRVSGWDDVGRQRGRGRPGRGRGDGRRGPGRREERRPREERPHREPQRPRRIPRAEPARRVQSPEVVTATYEEPMAAPNTLTPVAPLEPAPELAGQWSPLAPMGAHLRLQAAAGHRAAVVPLRPGLYLVAEIPDAQARSEFGAAAVLAPMVIKAATRALTQGQEGQPAVGPQLLQAAQRLLAPPQGMAQPAPAQPAYPAYQPQPIALPAPAQPMLPAPAPVLGQWVEAEDLAGALGFEAGSPWGSRR